MSDDQLKTTLTLNRNSALRMGWKVLRDEDEMNPYYDLYEITKGPLVRAIKAKNWNPATSWEDMGTCIKYAHDNFTRLEIEHDFDTGGTGFFQTMILKVSFIDILDDHMGSAWGKRSDNFQELILKAFCATDFAEAKAVWDETKEIRGDQFEGWD